MEHPEEHYYKVNRFLLSVTGLCPYQSKWRARLIRAVLTVTMLITIVLLINSIFITSDITVDYMVDWIPAFLIVLIALSNLYTRIIHVNKFRELFERMSRDWALQKTHDEAKIMHEHAETARLFTLCCLSAAYIFVGIYIIWMFSSEVLDIISPMNESRPQRQPINIQFFIDDERYSYHVRTQISVVLLVTTTIYISCTGLFQTHAQHVCGMCELLGYRAERLFCVVKNEVACDLNQKSQISYGNIAIFVQQHCNIIKFVDIIETCNTIQFLIDLIGHIIMMSLTLIQMLTFSNFERAFRSISVSIVGLCYMFMSCYMGQRIRDSSSSVCEKIFNCAWNNTVVPKQKALLIIMMRRYRPLILTGCKFYVMSLQNFGMILQTTISYCMFMRQF
ncbi:odorant receptor 10a-like isoform X1 [Temnothorax longispinosus]|uniref:odorant receptor 10a-like isoform X1 n=1 Tax=Temnothorax longispinosus TaxID=300112 RepID=UPI003A99BB7D